jgi:hypothetical protein
MGSVTGICRYCSKDAQDIPDLKHVKGILYSGDDGKVHCFRKAKPKPKDEIVVSKKPVVISDLTEPASETSEQANLLWKFASKKDFVPGLIDGRVFGKVRMWDATNGYGFIFGDNEIEYYTCKFEVAADEYNRRFLIVDEPVSFRTRDTRSSKHSQLSAVAVIPTPRVDPLLSAPADYRDEMVVVAYDPIKGTGRLSQAWNPTGSWVFFTRESVITEGSIYPGVRFWCGLRRALNFTQGFEAFQIEIIKEEKGDLA